MKVMSKSTDKSAANGTQQPAAVQGLNEFFSATEARVDRWRALHRITRALATADGAALDKLRTQAKAAFDELTAVEALNGYPGPHLMSLVGERLEGADWTGLARLVQKISGALLANSYRDDASAWSEDEENEALADSILPPTLGRGQSRRPYFEVLIVAAGERATWPALRETFRRLRRDEDAFVYEPVVVGSFEDAVLATLFNYNSRPW
jgi:arginine decarboxylase